MSVDDALLQRSRLHKHPTMLVRQERPLNLGTPVERVRQSFITAQTHFFVRNHGIQPWTWRFWRATLDLQPGQYQIIVRAWDSAGRTQPEDLAQVWNWKGYLNAAWHRINVSV